MKIEETTSGAQLSWKDRSGLVVGVFASVGIALFWILVTALLAQGGWDYGAALLFFVLSPFVLIGCLIGAFLSIVNGTKTTMIQVALQGDAQISDIYRSNERASLVITRSAPKEQSKERVLLSQVKSLHVQYPDPYAMDSRFSQFGIYARLRDGEEKLLLYGIPEEKYALQIEATLKTLTRL